MAKRRANGEGSIYQRKDGLWCGQFYVNGKMIYKYSRKQAEVRDWLLEMRRRHSDGLLLDASGMSVADYMTHWLMTAKPGLRPNTALQYEQVTRTHITPWLGKVRLRDLRPDQVQGLYGRLQEQGASARLVQLVHAILHRALNQAVRWQLVGRNAADGVERPRVPRREMPTLSPLQVRELLAVVKGTRWEALYHLAVYTGLRQGELLGLCWQDVNWEAGLLSVRRQAQRIPGQGTVFSEPKSAKSRRVVALDRVTLGLLKGQRGHVETLRAVAGGRWQEHDLVFPSRVGTPLGARNLLRHFKETLQEAGLPAMRFHDLRHTSATLLFQEGVHPKLVQERLGHSQIGLTLDTYSHVISPIDGGLAAVVEKIIERGWSGTEVVQ